MSFKKDFISHSQEIESSKSEKNFIFQLNIKDFADANGFLAFYHFDKLKDVNREMFSSKKNLFFFVVSNQFVMSITRGKSTD